MSEDNDILSEELDAALRQAGVGDADDSAGSGSGSSQLVQDLDKANTMLQQAMRQKQEADVSRRSAVEKANAMRAFQVESLEKNRKKIDQLQERLDVAEAALEEVVKDKESAEKAKLQAQAEAKRLKEEVMQAMHKSSEEISRLQDELMLASAQNSEQDGHVSDAAAQGMSEDDFDLMEQLRIARTLESDSTGRGSDTEIPQEGGRSSMVEVIKGGVLLTLVGSAAAIYVYKDEKFMAPVVSVVQKVQDLIGTLIASLVAMI